MSLTIINMINMTTKNNNKAPEKGAGASPEPGKRIGASKFLVVKIDEYGDFKILDEFNDLKIATDYLYELAMEYRNEGWDDRLAIYARIEVI